ncbi:MAG: chemotaxis protein CheW [Prochlorotrichaceae cyanobacterium]
MLTFSTAQSKPHLSRSSRHRKNSDPVLSFLTFQVKDQVFGLPIEAVEKAIVVDHIHGDASTGARLVVYQHQEIPLINAHRAIFQSSTISQSPFVVILKTQNHPIGITIDSAPSIRRIPQSTIVPLSETYRHHGALQCTSDLIQLEDHSIIFLLDPEKLLRF